jgi:hypothetical protein
MLRFVATVPRANRVLARHSRISYVLAGKARFPSPRLEVAPKLLVKTAP